MRGHVRKRGNKWSVVLDIGRDESGKRKQRWHSGFETKRDAERGLSRMLGELERGDYIEPARTTLATYLAGAWLPSIAASVRPSTLIRYRLDVDTLTRELGSTELQRVTGAQLDTLYAKRLVAGTSAASVRHLHAVAHRAFRDAVRNGLLARNPADAATPPRVARPEMSTWTASELRTFLRACPATA